MKVWPIDPLIAESFSLEVSEKLPQGLTVTNSNGSSLLGENSGHLAVVVIAAKVVASMMLGRIALARF